jgi:hypothetical protein
MSGLSLPGPARPSWSMRPDRVQTGVTALPSRHSRVCAAQASNGSRCRVRLKVYLMGVVRGLSLVSRMKTASSFAGSVLLALRLIEWVAPGASDQLSPAR